MKNLLLGIILLLLSTSGSADTSYQYPIDDPLIATVVGTPKADMAELPNRIPRKEMTVVVFPEREQANIIPRKALQFTLVKQKDTAPLVFSIAGTGSSHHSANMQLLEKAFYKNGFHVVSLPSPTYSNFIVTASSSQMPGDISSDSEDLYYAMQKIWQEIKDRVNVSEFYLTGYSLGGSQSAFVARIDEDKKAFNFKKVLMINPPVSLYNSVTILDDMLRNNIPGGSAGFKKFFDQTWEQFLETYREEDHVDFSDDFLFAIYKKRKNNIDPNRVAAIIGLSFRLSAANMVVVSDAMNNSGYILPKNHHFKVRETTTDYFKVAMRTSFEDYFQDMLHPYITAKQPGITQQQLIQESSLETMTDYLRSTNKIGVHHNEDDIILAPGEIDYFRETFGDRAIIYPKGGHCGNMAYRDNVAAIVEFFNQ
ncbi:MAG: alpha/beta hydrolase [Gammaproteobacteria bacterium]|nr:MAG: alpha/beta hydrolase [Gammaproteobacteria bacterium]